MEKLPLAIDAGYPIELSILTKSQMMLVLKSNIHHLVSERDIQILMPIYNGRLLPLDKDLRLIVIYTVKEVGRFEFEAVVTGRNVDNGIHTLSLHVLSDIKKSQRRNYFRVPYFEDLMINRLNKPLPEDVAAKLMSDYEASIAKYKNRKDIIVDDPPELFEVFKLSTRDISGGGIRSFSKEGLDIFELVKGTIHLEDFSVTFIGEVIRITPSNDIVLPSEIGIRFTEMEENSRTRLIGYIFKKQRNLMKKG